MVSLESVKSIIESAKVNVQILILKAHFFKLLKFQRIKFEEQESDQTTR